MISPSISVNSYARPFTMSGKRLWGAPAGGWPDFKPKTAAPAPIPNCIALPAGDQFFYIEPCRSSEAIQGFCVLKVGCGADCYYGQVVVGRIT